MKVAIYSQYPKKQSKDSLEILTTELLKLEATLFLEIEFFNNIKNKLLNPDAYKTFNKLDKSFDLFVSIGGDGTILRAVTYIKDLNIPVIGINTGRLGFLATIQPENIKEAIQQIKNKAYTLSKRTLLSIETTPENNEIKNVNFALNEIAISRKNTTSMITVDTKLNGEFLTSYWSDGLIISTPTGSTGYSLSCAGPVITPDTTSFVLTPIAPHNLSARPLVIEDSTVIELKVSGREDNYLVSLDSRIATLSNDTIITIKKSPFTINMIELNTESFLTTLRKKLLWGEDKRN
ncbi:NAD kinase [Lacinutrix sp. 5H-3-7-4]|uniref:NAD kinase n=1 Tax=Lacinutrix sp. (strain 5H-3-7-4) TaxID=983544 RepID=UPI00020A3693|nr:NAD kinase [Lacinutrix sp. 5H-3-7-4]AEH01261.1 inorganic polyphosphate/ATP-NAD kinase [Lacinutrix sp. 5H-3-7-4]